MVYSQNRQRVWLFAWLCWSICPSALLAQKSALPPIFEQLLDSIQVQFDYDALEAYKVIDVEENDYLNYDLSLYAKKERLAIRCRILPYDSLKTSSKFPNIEVGRLLATLSSNENDFYMTSRGIKLEDLEDLYHADWGMMHFFKPKAGFSRYEHCKMLTLYKEEVGTIFVLYLFDNVRNEALEKRKAIFTF